MHSRGILFYIRLSLLRGRPVYPEAPLGSIDDLERRLNALGYRVGTRVLELMVWRAESSSKTPKREIRFLPALVSIHTRVWRAVFGIEPRWCQFFSAIEEAQDQAP